jgi:hypothetical protein
MTSNIKVADAIAELTVLIGNQDKDDLTYYLAKHDLERWLQALKSTEDYECCAAAQPATPTAGDACLGSNAPCTHFRCTGNLCLECGDVADRYDVTGGDAVAGDEIERLRTENWQLKQACGYPIPADKETPQNPFKCGICDARALDEAARTREQIVGEQEPVAWEWQTDGGGWTPTEPPSADELKTAPHKFRPLYLGRMPAPACHDSHNSGESDPGVNRDCAGAGTPDPSLVQTLRKQIMAHEQLQARIAQALGCETWHGDLADAVANALAQPSTDHLDAEIGMLREKLSDALAGGLPHRSDCAVYQAPAYEPGPCNCGVGISIDDTAFDLVRKIREHNGWSRIATDIDAIELVKAFVASTISSTPSADPMTRPHREAP